MNKLGQIVAGELLFPRSVFFEFWKEGQVQYGKGGNPVIVTNTHMDWEIIFRPRTDQVMLKYTHIGSKFKSFESVIMLGQNYSEFWETHYEIDKQKKRREEDVINLLLDHRFDKVHLKATSSWGRMPLSSTKNHEFVSLRYEEDIPQDQLSAFLSSKSMLGDFQMAWCTLHHAEQYSIEGYNFIKEICGYFQWYRDREMNPLNNSRGILRIRNGLIPRKRNDQTSSAGDFAAQSRAGWLEFYRTLKQLEGVYNGIRKLILAK